MRKKPLRRTSRSEHIANAIKQLIASNAYATGSILPSSRVLACELGVARSTVSAAIAQLAAEGHLDLSQGRAPKVSEHRNARSPVSEKPSVRELGRRSDVGQRLHDLKFPAETPGIEFDFRPLNMYGSPHAESIWLRSANAALYPDPTPISHYDPLGLLTLRRSLSAYLWRSRGIRCGYDQIVVVNGSQQGIDLCARILLNPGDDVIVEDPGYILARHVFHALGARVRSLPVDINGMRTDLLHAAPARLAYTTPSHQFPLGGTLPIDRRRELLAWSTRTDAYIIEDDYEGEFRYDNKPVETLFTLSEDERVLYLGTMSKVFSPELRLGFLVVPRHLVQPFKVLKWITDRHSAVFQQVALHRSLISGSLERHIRRTRKENTARRTSLLDALRSTLGSKVTVNAKQSGLHIVLWFNGVAASYEDSLLLQLNRNGVALYGITQLFANSATRMTYPHAGAVLAYTSLSADKAKRGVKKIAEVLSNLVPRH